MEFFNGVGHQIIGRDEQPRERHVSKTSSGFRVQNFIQLKTRSKTRRCDI